MQLDTVHDVQRAYRKLISATSFPGTIVDISTESGKIDLDTDLMQPMLLLSIMLLDAEVGFAVHSSRPADHGQLVSQLTYSRAVDTGQAAFLFVTRAKWELLTHVIESARLGTLTDPHLGATLVLEVAGISAPSGSAGATAAELHAAHSGNGRGADSSSSVRLRLTGPGIEDTSEVAVAAPSEWIAARAQANAEYPLGIDMLLVSPRGRLVSLPRTTRLEIV